jgi:hypothetical protein
MKIFRNTNYLGVHAESTLWKLFVDAIKAYRERTEALAKSPVGETSIKQDLLAIIELLKPLGPVPGDLGFAKEEISTIHGLLANPQPKPLEVRFMFIVKDDHEPVNFSLKLGTVTDAEGNTIPDAQLDAAVESSDSSVVAVSFDPATKAGSVSFGSPGVASVTAQITSGGRLLGSGAADFTVTVGDPAAISAVDLNFEGLTEA